MMTGWTLAGTLRIVICGMRLTGSGLVRRGRLLYVLNTSLAHATLVAPVNSCELVAQFAKVCLQFFILHTARGFRRHEHHCRIPSILEECPTDEGASDARLFKFIGRISMKNKRHAVWYHVLNLVGWVPGTTVGAGHETSAAGEDSLDPKEADEVESFHGGGQAPKVRGAFELGIAISVGKVSIHSCEHSTTFVV